MRRFYDLHGVGLEIQTEAEEVLVALDRRLEAFRSVAPSAGALRMEFPTGEALEPVAAPSRPVYESSAGEVFYCGAEDVLHTEVDGLELRCHAGRGVARMSAPDYGGRRLYLAAHALATVCLVEMLKRRGLFNLHAACLAEDEASVLVAGPSGAGKSTLAIALGLAGLDFAADDMVYLAPGAEAVTACAFPDAIGITDRTADWFEELRPLLADPPPDGFPKRLVRPQAVIGAPVRWRSSPAVLVFPHQIPEGPSRLEAIGPGPALVRLVPDVLLTEPTVAQEHLGVLAALVEGVDSYVLHAGPVLRESVDLVVSALRERGGPARAPVP